MMFAGTPYSKLMNDYESYPKTGGARRACVPVSADGLQDCLLKVKKFGVSINEISAADSSPGINI